MKIDNLLVLFSKNFFVSYLYFFFYNTIMFWDDLIDYLLIAASVSEVLIICGPRDMEITKIKYSFFKTQVRPWLWDFVFGGPDFSGT